jgi:hypothetical protein
VLLQNFRERSCRMSPRQGPPRADLHAPAGEDTAVTGRSNSRLVPGAIAAQLFNELIVYAQDQEGGRPLANEQ